MNIMKINSTGQELENRTQKGRRGEILHTLKNKKKNEKKATNLKKKKRKCEKNKIFE